MDMSWDDVAVPVLAVGSGMKWYISSYGSLSLFIVSG